MGWVIPEHRNRLLVDIEAALQPEELIIGICNHSHPLSMSKISFLA